MLKNHISRIAGLMHSNRNGWLAAASLALILSSLLAAGGTGIKRSQSPSTASSPSMTDHMIHVLHGAFWRTDGGFVSTIRIKNVLVVAPIQVTPTLFMADGTPYPLAAVTVPISGVATVNINDALASAPQAIAAHISEFGSLMLLYSYPTPGHLVATLAAIDAPRSLSFVYMINEPMPMPEDNTLKVLEGLWWKHDSGVQGAISLSNTTDQQRTATLRATQEPGESDERQVELAPHSTQVLRLEQFSRETSDNDNRAGGIRVEYKGPEGAVMVTGSLANESEGYSANMPFWPHDQTRSPKKIDIGSAGIMVGKPDPMVMPGLPTDTKFIPYLALRNTTPAPLDVALRLNYMPSMAGAIPVNRDLPTQRLRPFEARKVDLEPMLRAAGLRSFNGSINLFISYTGRGGDLILANGSVDQSATYVFEVRPQGIGESIGRISGYWSVANGNDAMFSLWNPTDTPQDIVATLYYGDGSGTYHLPVHLAPQASAMIDVAMLITEMKPDGDGNVIPSSIREGSASFDSGDHDSSAPDGKKRVTTVIAGGLFNTANATCGMLCTYCNGYNNWIILPELIGPIGWTATASAHATDSYGNDQTLSGGSWSSSNSGIMSVGSYGGVQGISVGQVSIDDFIPNVIVYQGNFCVSDSMPDNCPQANINPSGPGTVVTAAISQRSSGTVSSDDAASANYQTKVGTMNLGNIIETGTLQGCGVGAETIGTIAPSSYTGKVIIHRVIVDQGLYINSTDAGGEAPPNSDDTSFPEFQDQDPQSGGSAGKVYDLDAPSLHPPGVDGNIYRYRTNFSIDATLPDGTVISPSYGYFFYVRMSCQQLGPGYAFINDVPGDNQIGLGTTKTTWNLQ